MLATTFDIFKSALRSDPTVTPQERRELLSLVRCGLNAPKSQPKPATPRVLTPKATAEMLSRSTRYVHRLAAEGVLQRVRLPNRTRGIGFLQHEVERLLSESLNQKEAS